MATDYKMLDCPHNIVLPEASKIPPLIRSIIYALEFLLWHEKPSRRGALLPYRRVHALYTTFNDVCVACFVHHGDAMQSEIDASIDVVERALASSRRATHAGVPLRVDIKVLSQKRAVMKFSFTIQMMANVRANETAESVRALIDFISFSDLRFHHTPLRFETDCVLERDGLDSDSRSAYSTTSRPSPFSAMRSRPESRDPRSARTNISPRSSARSTCSTGRRPIEATMD